MARIKKKEHENLSDANILKVIGLLENEKPITKKDACEILNISYNTARLGKIIQDFKDRQAYTQKRKDANRGKPASDAEIMQAVESYLEGDNYATIAKRLYRSSGFVRGIIERLGVPQRPNSKDSREPDYLPDECVSNEFNPGEIVWSAVYHRPAKVIKQAQSKGNYLGNVYLIYILEAVETPSPWFGHITKGGYFAYQPAYDLGKLEHLRQYGVDFSRI